MDQTVLLNISVSCIATDVAVVVIIIIIIIIGERA